MLNRKGLRTAFGIILLITVIFVGSILWNETWLSPEKVAVHVVIDNRTNEPIGPFVISEDQASAPLYIEQVEPLSVVDVYYRKSESWAKMQLS